MIHHFGSLTVSGPEKIKNVEDVAQILRQVVTTSGLSKVAEVFHQFRPYGVTGTIVLAESHINVHTWPEKNLVTYDICTCGGSEKSYKTLAALFHQFSPIKSKFQTIQRTNVA